jgi:hypothetical protein
MSDTPFREPPLGTKRVYWRPDPDALDEDLEAWAEAFVDAVLSNSEDPGEPPRPPLMRDT